MYEFQDIGVRLPILSPNSSHYSIEHCVAITLDPLEDLQQYADTVSLWWNSLLTQVVPHALFAASVDAMYYTHRCSKECVPIYARDIVFLHNCTKLNLVHLL